jgi:hypothetical protein
MVSLKVLAVSALAIAATCGVASAQVIPDGRVYVFHSAATGGCPALDWHVVAGANNTLSGMVAWDDMKMMAMVSGQVGPDRTFKMIGKRVGAPASDPGATVDGMVRPDGWLVANIHGPKVECQGIKVSWYVPQPGGGN